MFTKALSLHASAQCRRWFYASTLAPLLLALLAWTTPQVARAQVCTSPGSGIPSSIDFSVDSDDDALEAGDLITSSTFTGIDISVVSTGTAGLPLVIFDTENPTGGDFDLGTPNQTFGGPGVGAAGGAGKPGENPVGLGNSMIINEDWDLEDPDDWGSGGTITFIFSRAVEVRELHTLDADHASRGRVRVYSDAAGTTQVGPTVFGQALGENSFQVIDVSQPGIRRMDFTLTGSGTIDKLVFCGGTASFGDTVYHDANENGVPDVGEVGIPDVKVWLRDDLGVVIDSVLTDELGRYNFPNLLTSTFTADVDESTLPAGVYHTSGNEPDTEALSLGEEYLDGDFGYNGGLLPVELSSFEVALDGRAALLTWETASETNNAGFEIQRISKNDGASPLWEVVGFVEGYGTTELPQAYAYRIEALAPGRYVFRLKQIDFDGTFEYHPEVEVFVEMVERFVVEPAYPNPFNPEAQMRFAVNQAQQVEVGLYNMLGRRVKVLYQGIAPAGQMQGVRIDGAGLPSGLYLVRVVGASFAKTQTVTLLK